MTRIASAATLAAFFTIAAYGQIANTTALVGTVTDSSGKSIAGAAVSAVNTGTQDTYNATTNELGYYNIQFIRIGKYELTVKQSGFQTHKAIGIVVENNQVVRNDITLNVGDLVQTISVEGTSAVVKTDEASVSETISSRNVADLPLNGRDPLRLAATTPGVIQGLKATNGVPPGQDFIGAGTREVQNSVSLDGISIVNNLITTTPVRPTVDAVQEVEVQTGTYSAQYGAYMGVHINVVTKTGTNQLHGNFVEFLRNDKLDARPYFLSPTSKKSPLRQNQFGFEVDGPVVIPHLYDGRNRTFFMGSYEGLRQIRQTSRLGTLVTPKMWQGDFSEVSTIVRDPVTGNQFAGNIIPANRLSPIAQKLRQYYPNTTSSGISNNIQTSLANNNNTDQTVDRVDQNVGDKIRLFFRYNWQNMELVVGAVNPFNAATQKVKSNNFTAGYTHTLSPALVNDFRIGRQFFDTSSLNDFYLKGLKDAGSQLGIPSYDGDVKFNNPGIPDFNISGFEGFGNSGTNWFQDDKTWQASDQLSWTKGAHTIMAGAEFRKFVTSRAAINSPRGTFTFNGSLTGYAPADFILGLQQSNVTPGNQIKGQFAEWRDGFFVLDKWQASRKLTLNYGIRYELPTVPYTVNGFANKLNPENTALIPSTPTPGFKLINPTHKSFAPRFGLAYRLSTKTVLRAGFGIYYNPNHMNSWTLMTTNPPFSSVTSFVTSATTPLSLASPVGSAATPPPPDVFTVNWDLPVPSMNQWSFALGRELWRGAGVDIQYLGSHSMHLDRSYYNNTPLPGAGAINPRRPNQRYTVIRTIQNDLISNYEGLSLVMRQRMTHGVQFYGSYTWAHTLDVSSDSNNGGASMDPYNWRLDYGNSNWDIRHRLVGTAVYDLPSLSNSNALARGVLGGWQVNGSLVWQSGLPFNVSTPTDTANTAARGVYRPNLIAKPTSDCGGGHLVNCISPSAFAMPASFAYGNSGRNLLHGPALYNLDMSIFKNFPIAERLKLQFRAEFFNATNTPSFRNPAAGLPSCGIPSATCNIGSFGNITETSTENRDIQFGLKLMF